MRYPSTERFAIRISPRASFLAAQRAWYQKSAASSRNSVSSGSRRAARVVARLGPPDKRSQEQFRVHGPAHSGQLTPSRSASGMRLGAATSTATPRRNAEGFCSADLRLALRSEAGTYPAPATEDGAFMEPSGRNRWQPVANATAAKRLKQAKTVAVGCDRLRPGPHGKEGVDCESHAEDARTGSRASKAASSNAWCAPRRALSSRGTRQAGTTPSRRCQSRKVMTPMAAEAGCGAEPGRRRPRGVPTREH